jgi:hypothetical protein
MGVRVDEPGNEHVAGSVDYGACFEREQRLVCGQNPDNPAVRNSDGDIFEDQPVWLDRDTPVDRYQGVATLHS